MLLFGIDEAGYGPVLGPLCHGFTAIRVPDTHGDSIPVLWDVLQPLVSRAGGGGLVIDDSKKVYAGGRGLTALEEGVRAFSECVNSVAPKKSFDLSALLPESDIADLCRDAWAQEMVSPSLVDPCNSENLRNELEEKNIRVAAVGARAMSAREFNAALSGGANKADVSWRIIASELKRLAALSVPNESVFAAIDRQGGRKFYAARVAEIFETTLVQIECETDAASVYCIETGARKIRIGFFTGGESRHLPIALASMAAKLAREMCMTRFNAYFQKHQPGLNATAGYYTDAQRFLRETVVLRAKLKIQDSDLIRAK